MVSAPTACLTLLLFLVAGCAGNSPSGPAEEESALPLQEGPATPSSPTPASNATPPPLVSKAYHSNRTVGVLAGGGLVGVEDLEIPVTVRTVRIEASLEFSSADGAQDLDVVLAEPGADALCAQSSYCVSNVPTLKWADPPSGWHENANGSLGSPDSPSRIAVDAPPLGSLCDCTWTARAYSRYPLAASVTFSLKVTTWETA